MTSQLTTLSPLFLRAILEVVSCVITILLNILFIVTIIRTRTLHTPQNVLLANSAFNLLCSCFLFLGSVAIALQYSQNQYVNMRLCRIIGYLICSFCHGIMYSYLLVSISRLLHTFYHSEKYYLTMKFIIIEIIIQWLLAFIMSSIPLFFNQIEFQVKPRICLPSKPLYMTMGIFTGFLLPVISITAVNFFIYYHITKLYRNGRLSIDRRRKCKLNELYRLPRNEQNRKNVTLLHQFTAFSSVFIIGWGSFALISIFDIYNIVPESIYLITLSFPAISLVFITLMIINWNKTIKKSLFSLFSLKSNRKKSTSFTTVHFSTHLGVNGS